MSYIYIYIYISWGRRGGMLRIASKSANVDSLRDLSLSIYIYIERERDCMSYYT